MSSRTRPYCVLLALIGLAQSAFAQPACAPPSGDWRGHEEEVADGHDTGCPESLAVLHSPATPAEQLISVSSPATVAPVAAGNWLVELFPHTGQPGRLQNRLRRLSTKQFNVQGRTAGSVVVELTYPGLEGRERTGQARIYLPPELRDDPSQRVPLIHQAGYSVNQAGASGLLAQGYAVSTPHGSPLNPLGRGVNLDRAILHAVRQLDCIDPLRVSVQGGSAGGWMTLMLAADSFPLVCAIPDVPPIHWGYNADYIARHQPMAGPADGSETPRLPVVRVVGPIAAQSKALYGLPFDHPAYLASSPLAHLETITAPTLVTFSTADMLVPIDQVSSELVQPFDPAAFPAGFSTAILERFPGIDGQQTLLAALPLARYQLFQLPPVQNATRLVFGAETQGEAMPLVLPFSKDKVWSIVVIDEGPVEPAIGHFKYRWSVDHEPFRQWAEQQGVQSSQLTAAKLERLMKRVLGQPWRPLQVRPGGKRDLIAANLLDYPEAERADVAAGLAAFAEDDAHARHLARLYTRLPVELKAVGPRLGDGSPDAVRAALQAGRNSPP